VGCGAVDIFRQAAELNRCDERRQGNVVTLEPSSRVVCTGDIHGYRAALTGILSHAKLGSDPNCRLILQEILHGPPDPQSGCDRSIELMMRAARLKIEHPEQVILVMGNHDLAQVSGSEISKYGYGVCKEFVRGVQFAFGDDAGAVNEALDDFFMSLTLAVRCPGGVFISHSVPSPGKFDQACKDVLDREMTVADMQRNAPAYNWVWGRRHTAEQLETLAGELGVEFFLMAHQHTEAGYNIISRRGAVVLSDHKNGYIVDFRADQKISGDSLRQYLKPLSGL